MPLQRTASRRWENLVADPAGLVTATAASTATTRPRRKNGEADDLPFGLLISDEELANRVTQVAPVVGVATLKSASQAAFLGRSSTRSPPSSRRRTDPQI
jgi:hypothetical protein